MDILDNGYFMISRLIFESAIWRDNPHILKLFIWIIGNARHDKKPKRYPEFNIERGELVTSLTIISQENEYTEKGRVQFWSRQRVSRMLAKLVEQKYIEILADTYGTHIKVCNYDTYQDANSYKRTQTLQVRNGTGTGADINNKEKNVKNVKKKDYITLKDCESVKLTQEEYDKLGDELGVLTAKEKIKDLHLYLQSTGRQYKSHYSVVLAWSRKDKRDGKRTTY